MKFYLFLTSLIKNIGGGHIYTVNKIKYLESKGFMVDFYHADIRHGGIVINDLVSYENNCDFHLQYPPYIFSKKTQKNIVDAICEKIPKDCGEIIIESQTIICATWGELVANQLKAKHFIFLLSEHHNLHNEDIFEFFKYKLNRGELAGIQKKSLPMLFKGWYELRENEKYFLLAHCYNSLKNIPYSEIKKVPKSDYTIGSIGRIDKLYMIKILQLINVFAKNHPDKTFTLLIIGGSSNKNDTKKIYKIFKNTDNFKVFITGLIYPIPVELVLIPDVFVSTSGSCRVSHSIGKTTIPIDNSDFKPIGILGETTNNTLYRSEEIDSSIDNLLNDILFLKKYNSNVNFRESDFDINYDYSDHLEFVKRSDNSKVYFDISKAKLSLIDWIEKTGLVIFGSALYPEVVRLLSPIWMKLKRK